MNQWRDKEATRDAVRIAVRDFLWDETRGLPSPRYSENEVQAKVEKVFGHFFRTYPQVPSPYYGSDAAA